MFFIPSFSQTTVGGKVTDSSGNALPGTSVTVSNSEGKIITFTIVQEDGSYTVKITEEGKYILDVNSLGFEKTSVTIQITKSETVIQNFILQESAEVLREVVIVADNRPVKKVGDTLVYDAKALSTGHEAVVEDLLRNIPGISILDDGTIKYGDTTIEKVMVDGDDLFSRGYSLLTKNMPVQPLDKVEILRNYSKNKLLHGIEDSNAVALNLTVAEEYKNIWFGNLTAGYGNDNRYKASGNLMNFSKYYKNFFSFAFNNAGYDNVGNISGMQYNSSDLETLRFDNRAAQVMHLGSNVSRIDEDRARFNNAEMATLSTILPLGTKAKLRLNGFIGLDELNTYNNALTVLDFEDTFIVNNEVNNSRNNIKKAYVSAYLNYDISSKKMLQSLSTFNSGSNKFKNNYIFNNTSTLEQLQTKSTYFDQQLTYTHKWKERNVVLLKSRFLTDKLPQSYSINDYLLGDLFTDNGIHSIGNDINSSKEFAGLEADFKLKQKNNDLIAFTVGYQYSTNHLATRFTLFADNATIQPVDFQADANYKIGDLYAQSGYTWKINKFAIGGKIDAHQLFNQFESINSNTKTQNPIFANIIANVSWEISPDDLLSGYYIYNIDNSNILQVNDAYLLTSSRSFTKGLGHFNQLENSSANLNFLTKHYLNRYSFSAGLSYSRQNDIISYRSRIDQNSSLSEAFVMRGGDRSSINLRSHFMIRKFKGSLALEAGGSRYLYFNQINGSELRKNIIYNQTYTIGWRSSFKSAFNFNFRTDWNFTRVESDNTFSNTTKFSYLDLMYAITDKLDIKVKGEHYNFGGLDTYNNYFFADFEAKYSFKKDKYSISLDGRNLFNTDKFTTYSVSDIGYSTNSYRLLPRYVMLSFMYRF